MIVRTATTALTYGPHPDQTADLYLPPVERAAPAPLVMFLHGGFWRAETDREHAGVAAEALARQGFVVANIEYRRVGAGGGWPHTFTDVAQAADTLPALIARAAPGRADLDRVVWMGHSAGGQLALWTALRHKLPDGAPGRTEAPVRMAGVVALAPAADLVEANRLGSGRGSVANLLGGGPEQFPERYAAVDPTLLGPAGVPLVLIHGQQDDRLPVTLARDYAKSVDAVLISPADVDHFSLIDPDSGAWPHVLDALAIVLERQSAIPSKTA